MDKRFVPQDVEQSLYSFWEKEQVFEARVNSDKEPFCIILPPPNANADLHMGHGLFVYEDIMTRYQRMNGKEALWLPGFDHAGIETQFVFEKHLKKQKKSRFDYDRKTLYAMIQDFVAENRPRMREQLKRLGLSLDWSKETFTLDEDVATMVNETFKRLFDEGLIYRDVKLVNYSVACGTSYSDYEVVYKERTDALYYMKYGPFTLATVRPETKFGDTAVAVNPKDKRYNRWIGKEVEVEGLIGPFTLRVIGDEAVDPEFGTGVVKVTPAHDFNDFEMARRHDLEIKQVIGFDGRLNEHTGPYVGMKVAEARKKVAEDMEKKGMIVKIDHEYVHRVGHCYRSGQVIEPLPKEQWFVKVRPLADRAKQRIENGDIQVYPKRFKKQLIDILDTFIDWNISRQIVWGIQVPAYFSTSRQEWLVITDPKEQEKADADPDLERDPDTFDTWFSSGQWPFVTLKAQAQRLDSPIFDYFYPTTVMETGYDILRPWVARMIMLGDFITGEVPFTNIVLHGMLRDKYGQKMSKSKGNVINPTEMIKQYGTDALRAAFIFGTKEGSDVVLSEEKVRAMRNFANKLWNIGRFLYMAENPESQSSSTSPDGSQPDADLEKDVKQIIESLKKEYKPLSKKYKQDMDKYRFAKAFDDLYHFVWHRFADFYIEELKDSLRDGNIGVRTEMKTVYLECLKQLHPFVPFVTEAIWQVFHGTEQSIMREKFAG